MTAIKLSAGIRAFDSGQRLTALAVWILPGFLLSFDPTWNGPVARPDASEAPVHESLGPPPRPPVGRRGGPPATGRHHLIGDASHSSPLRLERHSAPSSCFRPRRRL